MTKTARSRHAAAVVVAVACGAAMSPGASAQSSDDLMREIRDLKERVLQLEKALAQRPTAAPPTPAASAPAASASSPTWGMTPQQVQDLNRANGKVDMLEASWDAQGLRGLRIGGQIDPTYLYDRAQDRAGFHFLSPIRRNGYHVDDSFFGMAVLDLEKEFDSGTRLRLTLAPQRGAGSFGADDSIVHEASAIVPLAYSRLKLMAGQFPSWSGYESLLPTRNRLITHNLLVDFTQPQAYTGAGAEWVDAGWRVKGLLANLDASTPGGGRTPALVYRADWLQDDDQTYGFSGVHGRAANRVNGGPDTWLNTFEVDGYVKRRELVVQWQLAFGQQNNAAVTPDPLTGAARDSQWWGASALVAYRFTRQFEGTVRADFLGDSVNGGGTYALGANGRDGIGPEILGRAADGSLVWRNPDRGANRSALSLGVSFDLNANTSFKAEYRLDRASVPVFEYVGDGSVRRTNQLFGASMVLSF